MSFFEDIADWVDDQIVEPTAHFLRNVVDNPIVPLMIVGGIAVSVLAPEFLPAMLPMAEAVFAGEAAAATEAVLAVEAADVGIGAAELAAESESSLLIQPGLASEQSLYNTFMMEGDAAQVSGAVDEVAQEQAINVGESQRAANLPSRFNKVEQLVTKSARALSQYNDVKETVREYDESYMNKRRKTEYITEDAEEEEERGGKDPSKPTPTPPPQPGPSGDSKDPSWNDPGSTNRQGALHDLGLWRANAAQVNFATTPIVPRDMDDDPRMSQSGDYIRMKQAVYRRPLRNKNFY